MKKREFTGISIIIVFWLLFFGNVLFTYKTYFIQDIFHYFYPTKIFLNSQLAKGIIPFWNPFCYSGTPFLAYPQTALFYPFSIIFNILSFPVALKYFTIVHFLLAGVFTYLLMRNLKIGIEGSIVSSLVFAFGGWLVSQAQSLTIIGTAIWLPLLFLGLRKSLFLGGEQPEINQREQLRWPWIVFLSLIFSVQFLAGQYQIFFYSLVGLSLYAIFESILSHIHKGGKRFSLFSLSPLFILIMGFLFGILISMHQLLPSLVFLFNSERLNMTFAHVACRSVPPIKLLDFLMPFFFGFREPLMWDVNLFFMTFSVGIIPVILAIFAVVLRRDKYTYFFFTVFILSILLALGEYTPLFYILFKHVFFFSVFRYPCRWMYLASFSLAIIAGFGFDCIIKRINKRVIKFSLSLFTILIVFFNLFFLYRDFNPRENFDIISGEPGNISFLKKDKDLFRYFKTPYTKKYHTLNEDLEQGARVKDVIMKLKNKIDGGLGMLYGLYDLEGFDGMKNDRYNRYLFVVNRLPSAGDSNKLLSLANVKYVISVKEIKSPQYKMVNQKGDYKIYENQNWLQRVYVVPKAVPTKTDQVLEYINSADFNPDEEVVVETDSGGREQISVTEEVVPPLTYNVKIDKYSPNRINIQAELNRSGWLVLNDAYYPYWRVYVNGERKKIYRANYAMRTVYLPSGKHRIEFVYVPMPFIVGLIVSFLSVCLIVFLLVRYFKCLKESKAEYAEVYNL